MELSATAQPAVSTATMANESRRWNEVFLGLVVAMALVLILRPAVIPLKFHGDHYLYLARHLAMGDLTVDSLPDGIQDYVIWQGHKYLPLGPLPGVLLIPFLPFMQPGEMHDVAWVGHLFTLLNIWLFYRLLGSIGIRDDRRKWGVLLFFGGTVYFSIAAVGTSWFFAHIVATTFLLLAMLETVTRRRPVLMGLLLGLAGLTRMTVLFSLPFFAWMLLSRASSINRRTAAAPAAPGWRARLTTINWSSLFLLSGGLAGPLLLLFAYNYARFGNVLDSGYGHAVLTDPVLAEALKQGMFSLVHVPKNLFMMLLQGPVPFPSADAPVLQFPYVWASTWGMGLFYTSPALVYIFRNLRTRLKEPLVQACWLAVLCTMVPIITYYGIGWVQFGYRYALDFTPFLVVLACIGLPSPQTTASRALIVISVLVNLAGAIFLWKMV